MKRNRPRRGLFGRRAGTREKVLEVRCPVCVSTYSRALYLWARGRGTNGAILTGALRLPIFVCFVLVSALAVLNLAFESSERTVRPPLHRILAERAPKYESAALVK
jgi:hypothetical protein